MKKYIIIGVINIIVLIGICLSFYFTLANYFQDKSKTPSNDSLTEIDLSITIDAPTFGDNYLIEGDIITITCTSNGNIANLTLNEEIYLLTNNQLQYTVLNEPNLTLAISKITIDNISYNISKYASYKVISQATLTNIIIETKANPHNVIFSLANIENIPITIARVNSDNSIATSLIYTNTPVKFDNLSPSSVYHFTLAIDRETPLVFKNLDIQTPMPLKCISSYNDKTYSYELAVTPAEDCELISYTFAGKTYPYNPNELIKVTKPKGQETNYSIILTYSDGDNTYDYAENLYFPYNASLTDFNINVKDYNDRYEIYAYPNEATNLVFSYNLKLYLDDNLISTSQANYITLNNFYFNRSYTISASLSYLNFVTMEIDTLTKTISFTTKSYYADGQSFFNFDHFDSVIKIMPLLPDETTITGIDVYLNQELVNTYQNQTISDLLPGNTYKFQVHYLLNEHNGLEPAPKTESFSIYIPYKLPNLKISLNPSVDSVSYSITNTETKSLVTNLLITLYENGSPIATNSSYQSNFTNLDYLSTYEIILDYDYYSDEIVHNTISTGTFNVIKGPTEPDFTLEFLEDSSAISVNSSIDYPFTIALESVECGLFDFPLTTTIEGNKILISDWPFTETSWFSFNFVIKVFYTYNDRTKIITYSKSIVYREGVWDFV